MCLLCRSAGGLFRGTSQVASGRDFCSSSWSARCNPAFPTIQNQFEGQVLGPLPNGDLRRQHARYSSSVGILCSPENSIHHRIIDYWLQCHDRTGAGLLWLSQHSQYICSRGPKYRPGTLEGRLRRHKCSTRAHPGSSHSRWSQVVAAGLGTVLPFMMPL